MKKKIATCLVLAGCGAPVSVEGVTGVVQFKGLPESPYERVEVVATGLPAGASLFGAVADYTTRTWEEAKSADGADWKRYDHTFGLIDSLGVSRLYDKDGALVRELSMEELSTSDSRRLMSTVALVGESASNNFLAYNEKVNRLTGRSKDGKEIVSLTTMASVSRFRCTLADCFTVDKQVARDNGGKVPALMRITRNYDEVTIVSEGAVANDEEIVSASVVEGRVLLASQVVGGFSFRSLLQARLALAVSPDGSPDLESITIGTTAESEWTSLDDMLIHTTSDQDATYVPSIDPKAHTRVVTRIPFRGGLTYLQQTAGWQNIHVAREFLYGLLDGALVRTRTFDGAEVEALLPKSANPGAVVPLLEVQLTTEAKEPYHLLRASDARIREYEYVAGAYLTFDLDGARVMARVK